MRVIDEKTNLELTDPDLETGYTYETVWASPEAYATIDNIEKFALDDEDYEVVLMYHVYTQDELDRKREKEEEDIYLDSRYGITDEWLIHEIVKSVTIQEPPAESLARKIGEICVPHYDASGNTVYWTMEPDPTYKREYSGDGSPFSPFWYTIGMAVQNAMWYTDGEYIWEAIKDGIPNNINDTEYFDVIEI